MILMEVENFGGYPDGRLRAGPFKQDRASIGKTLSRYNLHLGNASNAGVCSRTMKGVMISCAGEDVFGYLLDADGLEAPSTDLEAFLEEVVVPGSIFTIEGHHCPNEDCMIFSNVSAWLSNGEIKVTCNRYVEHRDGSRIQIHSQAPVSVTQSAGDGLFCLVG